MSQVAMNSLSPAFWGDIFCRFYWVYIKQNHRKAQGGYVFNLVDIPNCFPQLPRQFTLLLATHPNVSLAPYPCYLNVAF